MTIKCAYCGKFISYEDMDNGKAKYELTPDSHFGPESSCWICAKCNALEESQDGHS